MWEARRSSACGQRRAGSSTTPGRIGPSSPGRIEFVQGFAKEDGTRVAPAELGLPPGIPEEVRHVVTLSPIDSATTRLTVREYGYPNPEIVEISRAGMEQVLDKMAATVAGA